MKIFIANVPHKMDEPELKTMLIQFGQVASVKLVTDAETGKRKGFGFVEMPVKEQAKAAITALNEKEIYGRKLSLKEAEENQHDREGNFQWSKREYRSSGGNNTG
jgi:RNA recognition motif-containing protein